MVVGLGAQLVEGDGDLCSGVAAFCQVIRQQAFFDVAVAVAVGPVAQVAIAQLFVKERNTGSCVARSGLPMSFIFYSSSMGNSWAQAWMVVAILSSENTARLSLAFHSGLSWIICFTAESVAALPARERSWQAMSTVVSNSRCIVLLISETVRAR